MLPKLAFRNLGRNRRRTLLTLSAMTLATALLIVVLGILDGMVWDMLTGATDNYHGEAKIMAPGYLDDQKTELALDEDDLARRIAAMPDVVGVAGRVRTFALLSRGAGEAAQTQPAELLGIAPREEQSVTTLAAHTKTGRFLQRDDGDGIVIGAGLAKRLAAGVGDEIVAMGQAADGTILAGIYHVRGVFDSGDSVRDASLALVGRATLQRQAVLDGKISEYVVRLRDPLQAAAWARAAQAALPQTQVASWETFLPQVAGTMQVWRGTSWFYIVIFYFAVILVSINTMYMAFFERMHEFAVMGAIGLKPGRLERLLLLEGFFLSAAAAILGGALGGLGSWALYKHPVDLSAAMGAVSVAGTTLPPHVVTHPSLFNVAVPILVMAALGFLIAIFPARRLRRLRPVEALRQG